MTKNGRTAQTILSEKRNRSGIYFRSGERERVGERERGGGGGGRERERESKHPHKLLC